MATLDNSGKSRHGKFFSPKSSHLLFGVQINPRHPLLKGLLDLVEEDAESETLADTAWLLHDTAVLQSGFAQDDVEAFSLRMFRTMKVMPLERACSPFFRQLIQPHPSFRSRCCRTQGALKLDSMDLEPELEVEEDVEEEEAEEDAEAEEDHDEL